MNNERFEWQTRCEFNAYCKHAFRVGDMKITAKLLAEALRTLPDEKRKAVLLYYFVNKSDVEIAEELGIPLVQDH